MIHPYLLIAIVLFLIFISCFFSASETSMMSINRYRLRHLVRQHNLAAKRVSYLLERPDRLLGMILIGNTFANMLCSSVVTMLTLRWYGNWGVVTATFILALIILVFSEIMPKTLAALYPERLAFSAATILTILLKIFYPLVWCANVISNGFLKIFNIHVDKKLLDELTNEEVRTLVYETTGCLPFNYRHMMLGVLDLGGLSVSDIKVPKNNIVGIDLDQEWETILAELSASEHTRLPMYNENINNVRGILHVRKALNLASQGKLDKNHLLTSLEEVYFIPEGTALNVQLVQFKEQKKRIGLVVDEYGDVQGLVTLEDILEEIVGEFTTNISSNYKSMQQQTDGTYLVDASISIRELNRRLHWELPVNGPKTLSGLIVEYLETIPEARVGLRLEKHPMEVIQVEENTIKTVKIWPVEETK